MSINLFESLDIVLAPGQTREVLQGSPEFLVSGIFNGISIVTRAVPPPAQVTLVRTFVARDAAGNARQGYVVKNESSDASVEFRRTTVRIDPF
jgi:hypothetical protein